MRTLKRWVWPRGRSARLPFWVWLGGVVALGTAIALIAATALVAPVEDESSETDAVPLTGARLAVLIEAATSCPTLRPARLAGLVMATTAFEPTNAGGIGGLTADEWEAWKPWSEAVPTNERASLLALAHLTCDLVGRLRSDGIAGDLWRLAVAAFETSLDTVRETRAIPADAAAYVQDVERYAASYHQHVETPPTQVSPAGTGPPTTVGPTPTATTPAPTTAAPTTAAPSPPHTASTAPAPPPPPATGQPPTLAFPNFNNTAGLRLNGYARTRDGRIVLAEYAWRAGSVFANTRIDIRSSFSTSFSVLMTGVSDGFAFVVQTEGTQALGGHAGGLGVGPNPNHPNDASPISPSVAVEFDSYSNDWEGWDPPGQHVAVTEDGDVIDHLIWVHPGSDMSNGQQLFAWIDYDATAQTLTVSVSRNSTRPSQPLFTHPVNLRAQLGADQAYVGFTGGTGNVAGTDTRESLLTWSLSSS